jgi:hypothetical protein
MLACQGNRNVHIFYAYMIVIVCSVSSESLATTNLFLIYVNTNGNSKRYLCMPDHVGLPGRDGRKLEVRAKYKLDNLHEENRTVRTVKRSENLCLHGGILKNATYFSLTDE